MVQTCRRNVKPMYELLCSIVDRMDKAKPRQPCGTAGARLDVAYPCSAPSKLDVT
jgi:hypothetical protein